MNTALYKKNIEALERVSPAAAAAVAAVREPPAGMEFLVARSGKPTARYRDAQGRIVHLHSAYDPDREAVKFAFSHAPAFGKWLVWLGPGLWYGVRELKKRMFHCPVCVIEPDPALLRAVLERVPVHDVLALPGMRVITGGCDEILADLRARPLTTEYPRNVIAFLPAVQRMPAAFLTVSNALERIVAGAAPERDPLNTVRPAAFGSMDPSAFRILISANDRYSDAVAHTLAPLGVQVKSIFDFPDTESLIDFNPGLLFMFSANLMNWPDTLTLMQGVKRKLGIPMIVWNMEDPMYFGDDSRELLMRVAQSADLYFTQSAQYLKLYAAAGAQAVYLPTGARPDMAGDPLPPGEQTLDFSFFGFWTPWRRAFFDKLTDLTPDLKYRLVAPGMAPEDYRDMIRHTRVNLTALTNCDLTAGDHWALSDRAWEIPYAGGFLLQDDRKHLADHFAPGEYAAFSSAGDCAEKIRYYVAHPLERAAILDAARARVRAEHLWAHRMETLIALLRERNLIPAPPAAL